MVDLSTKPLSASHLRSYFRHEYSVASNAYYTEQGKLPGIWYGAVAKDLGLSGPVDPLHFERLAAGRHPLTGDILVAAPTRPDAKNNQRAGWDLVINAPKGVSLTAIVGNDPEVLKAHHYAVYRALDVAQQYIQTRAGARARVPFTTARFAVAVFHHDVARPVDGYPAPHLHSHCVIFNITNTEDGRYRALQTYELYKVQTLIDAEYQAHMGKRLRELGYHTERSTNFAVDVAGYTPEYLSVESPRTKIIDSQMKELGLSGRHASSEIAHRERDHKLDLTPETLAALHQHHAWQYGNQPQRVVEEAADRRKRGAELTYNATPVKAVDYSRDHLFYRTQVADHWELVRDAQRYRPGTWTVNEIEREIANRMAKGEFRLAPHIRPHAPGARYKTWEAEAAERNVLQRVVAGRNAVQPIATHAPLWNYPILADNERRQAVLSAILATRDQIVGLQGAAGTGKSTSLGILADVARAHGWRVVGLAPTGKSTQELASVGISSHTLQHFNARPNESGGARTLYFLDESSLVATRQMQAFLERIGTQDHVVVIGDDSPFRKVGQHTAVEAGRIFRQMQEAGMPTGQLNKIVRQKDEALKQVVMALRDGKGARAIELLENQGRICQISHRGNRYDEIAKDYADSPANTLIVTADNASRMDLNRAIRAELQSRGLLAENRFLANVLVARDVTPAQSTRAATYRTGDVVFYRRGNKKLGITAGTYGTVSSIDTHANQIALSFSSSRCVSYDPEKHLRGTVTLYTPREQPFATGDRIQFTAKHGAAKTRDTGYIAHIDESGNATIRLDRGNKLRLNLTHSPHLDYGYAMTSHASQSMTVDRVLIHAESDSKLSQLVNREFAYVAGSRSRHDLTLYTDDKKQLHAMFGRTHEKHTALSREENLGYAMQM